MTGNTVVGRGEGEGVSKAMSSGVISVMVSWFAPIKIDQYKG